MPGIMLPVKGLEGSYWWKYVSPAYRKPISGTVKAEVSASGEKAVFSDLTFSFIVPAIRGNAYHLNKCRGKVWRCKRPFDSVRTTPAQPLLLSLSPPSPMSFAFLVFIGALRVRGTSWTSK